MRYQCLLRPIPLWTTLLIFLACRNLTGSNESEILIRIEQHRSFWLAHEPAAYSYEFAGQCVCPPAHFQVTVRNKTVVEAKNLDTGEILNPSQSRPTLTSFFDQAERDLQQHALGPITFDDEFGFIVRLDSQTGSADSSGSTIITNFRILQ